MFKAMRPNQWTKNLVVMAAFFFSLGDRMQAHPQVFHDLLIALAATGIFCLASSGIYLLNDIGDIELDRNHPDKCRRPIAAGLVPVPLAWAMAAVLLIGGMVLAIRLESFFALTILAYILLQIFYTTLLKSLPLVDVILIATGFVLRALAGGLALKVLISPWLLLCAFLLALFLALCKRRAEMVLLEEGADTHRPSLGRYNRRLLDQLIAIVSSAAIVIYAIYTLWPETVLKFGTPALVLTVPLVIFGIFRYLDLVYRHSKGGHPDQILLTDKPLLMDLALYGLTVLGIFLFTR